MTSFANGSYCVLILYVVSINTRMKLDESREIQKSKTEKIATADKIR